MKNTEPKFRILSPDGFDIEESGKTYKDSEIMPACRKFRNKYKKQGYYSANYGRILLIDLFDEMQLVPVKTI